MSAKVTVTGEVVTRKHIKVDFTPDGSYFYLNAGHIRELAQIMDEHGVPNDASINAKSGRFRTSVVHTTQIV